MLVEGRNNHSSSGNNIGWMMAFVVDLHCGRRILEIKAFTMIVVAFL